MSLVKATDTTSTMRAFKSAHDEITNTVFRTIVEWVVAFVIGVAIFTFPYLFVQLILK